jgi:hypothetical protein
VFNAISFLYRGHEKVGFARSVITRRGQIEIESNERRDKKKD